MAGCAATTENRIENDRTLCLRIQSQSFMWSMCVCVSARERLCIGKGKSSMKTGTIIIITMIIDCDSIQIMYTNENALIAFTYEIAMIGSNIYLSTARCQRNNEKKMLNRNNQMKLLKQKKNRWYFNRSKALYICSKD